MPDEAAAVAETHAGVVFFVGDRAYKMKKPVNLGFLDYSTRPAREAACHREVELNRRLSPDVYLGVADVHAPSGEVADHLVVMRRMPVARRLSTLVTSGAPVAGELRRVAEVLVAFHATADRSAAADRCAERDSLARRWADNTAGFRPYVGTVVDADEVAAVDALAARYLAGRGRLIDSRIVAGRACDGHGDLLADDIFCLDDGPRILDCLEFDDALRFEDVLADVAFLAMDLERLGRPDLGASFLDTYRELSGDGWPASLAHHHVAYRAQVRAKVTAIRAAQGDEASVAAAGALLEICRRHLEAARVRIVVVGGLPGTGKSTLAAGLGEALDAVVLRSDAIRKDLLGIAPEDSAAAPFGEGAYDEATTAATYEELLRQADDHLSMGESVVLDASWTDGAWRARARSLAASTSSDLVELRCVAPSEVAAARLRARAERGGDPSDADAAVAAAMAAIADPWPEAVEVRTVGPPDAVLAGAVSSVV